MIVFPNCKINLGLHILNKRPDGFHNLETVFYPIPLFDIIEVVNKQHDFDYLKSGSYDSSFNNDFTLTTSGQSIPGAIKENILYKAWQLLKPGFSLPALQMHLHKNIPMGAGLGGGSADGAFALKLLNDKYNLGCSQEQLMAYALQLGSDCPFFLLNKPCYATGRGEQMQPIEIDLSGYYFVIVNPGIQVSTKEAFAELSPALPAVSIKDIIKQPIGEWKRALTNDFEKSIFEKHPAIANIKERLYQLGAVYASMSGSGSTVFGLFSTKHPFDDAFFQNHFPGCFTKVI